eukprot:350190-Chlamydomonas_euryale.AAC.5
MVAASLWGPVPSLLLDPLCLAALTTGEPFVGSLPVTLDSDSDSAPSRPQMGIGRVMAREASPVGPEAKHVGGQGEAEIHGYMGPTWGRQCL